MRIRQRLSHWDDARRARQLAVAAAVCITVALYALGAISLYVRAHLPPEDDAIGAGHSVGAVTLVPNGGDGAPAASATPATDGTPALTLVPTMTPRPGALAIGLAAWRGWAGPGAARGVLRCGAGWLR